MIKMIKIILFVGKVKDLRIQLKIERNKKRGQLVATEKTPTNNYHLQYNKYHREVKEEESSFKNPFCEKKSLKL